MSLGGPEPNESFARGLVWLAGYLGAAGLLAGTLAAAPLAAVAVGGPWAGVATAAGGVWVWGRVGPRPWPGCLPGTVFVAGVALITGSAAGCLAFAVRGWLVQ